MTFTVYPAVDIKDGRCVRLLQGRFGTETVYSQDPVEVALGLAAAGANKLHIVDLDGAKTGVSANRELVLEVIRRCSCPVQAGGGLRTRDDVAEILEAGAATAVLGTFALEDETGAREVCREFGPRLSVSLDARGGRLASRGWTVGTGIPLLDAVGIFESAGVSTFIYTDVERDGTMQGPDLQGLRRLASATKLPVIASGGVASLDDLRKVASLRSEGIAGCIVGRALYEGAFTVEQANRTANEEA